MTNFKRFRENEKLGKLTGGVKKAAPQIKQEQRVYGRVRVQQMGFLEQNGTVLFMPDLGKTIGLLQKVMRQQQGEGKRVVT